MAAARPKKEKPPPGPDELVRESAGVYRTGDGRFEVQKSDVGWYIVDTEQANEFGQQLIHGPLATLEAVRDQIPGTRAIKPLLRRARQTRIASDASKTSKTTPPPPPQSWIERLPDKEAADVRRLIRVLDKEGLKDAEELVRRHRADVAPLIATRLLENRLRALVDEQPETERERAQQLIRRVMEIFATDGANVPRPAPRWVLVDLGPDDAMPPNRLRPQI